MKKLLPLILAFFTLTLTAAPAALACGSELQPVPVQEEEVERPTPPVSPLPAFEIQRFEPCAGCA